MKRYLGCLTVLLAVGCVPNVPVSGPAASEEDAALALADATARTVEAVTRTPGATPEDAAAAESSVGPVEDAALEAPADAAPVGDDVGADATAVVDVPAAVVDVPAAVVDVPAVAVDVPAAVVDVPAGVVDVPEAVVDVPATVVDVPAAVVDVPAAGVDVPAAASDASAVDATKAGIPPEVLPPLTCTEETAPVGIPSPVTTTLPGESEACKALGVAACWYGHKPGCNNGQLGYICQDSAGKPIIYTSDSDPYDAATKLPCSPAQLQAWLDAHENPCWKLVPASAMPKSLATLVLDLAQVPTEVCSNIDGTQFQFKVGCSQVVFREQSETACMNWFAQWDLQVSPPTTALFKPGLAFLGCESFSTSGYAWSLSVAHDAKALYVSHYTGKWGNNDFAGILDKLSKNFTTCDAVYKWN